MKSPTKAVAASLHFSAPYRAWWFMRPRRGSATPCNASLATILVEALTLRQGAVKRDKYNGIVTLLNLLPIMHGLDIFLSVLYLTSCGVFAAPFAQQPPESADDVTEEQMKDAYPPRDSVDATNRFGTSLYGWDKCNGFLKTQLIESYKDANKLVNFDDVRSKIDWNSAAALEYLGPSVFNKDQQAQIQAVFKNAATVAGGFWPTPNWIRIRCDDPLRICSTQCATVQEDEDREVVFAYARNPGLAGSKHPDISFCPEFFMKRNLEGAINFGSRFTNPKAKNHLPNYEGRADIFLHELMHLDLVADSVNNSPNPGIRDLKIRYSEIIKDRKGVKKITSKWTKAYGPKLAKILARFQPISTGSPQTGYFVQRNVDNLVGFALANYVQQKIKSYPFLPIIYEKIEGSPMIPRTYSSSDPIVVFSSEGEAPVSFENFTATDDGGARLLRDSGACASVSTDGKNEDLQIGAPIADDKYPQAYLDERKTWLQSIKDSENDLGTCDLTITEVWTCEPVESNLYAEVDLVHADGRPIYRSKRSTRSPGQPINAGKSLSIQEDDMKEALVITGEHSNDYIQFTYGETSWTSGTTNGDAKCTLKGSDWSKDGPAACPDGEAAVSVCNARWHRSVLTITQTRKFECQYPC